jgi:putative peptide zinc metalloprotease protein
MKTETSPSDLERRKQVKLRLRTDLSIKPQRYEGRTYYVIKDPISLRYYRFKEHENFLLGLMDGKHTLDDAQKEFEKRFRPDRLTLEDLEQFGQQLLTAGLAQNESPQAGKQLFDRRRKRRRSELMQTFTNILYIKIPIFDPEKLLEKMLPFFRWMFTTWFLLVSVGVMLAAILLVTTHFQTFRDKLPDYQEFFSFKTIMYMWAALGVVKVIHEFGHGLSCKHFGGEVHEMGFLFLCFSPAMYCNVSDAWMLPNKWHRIIISGAGIYVELMIAAIATFVWWNSAGSPFINYMALALMVVCSVSTVMFNGNPLMRFDGYYVLADWLEIPNLRDRSNRYLQRVVMEHCLGIEVQPEPYMELWRRILFVTYAVTSYIYRWVITFVILKFMASFLKPYKLEVISTMLALMALGSMIGWPLYRLGKNLHKRGRLPDMKGIRVSISTAIVVGLLLVFFFVPFPVTRVRQTGLVQVQPRNIVQVHVEMSGTLQNVLVKEGQWVKEGTILAEFKSLELLGQEADAKTQVMLKDRLVKELKANLVAARDPKVNAELKRNLNKAENDRLEAVRHLNEIVEEGKKSLVLRARRSGVVMGLPKVDEIGKRWEKDQETPFCSIGDPMRIDAQTGKKKSNLRVLVPVPPSDYELIRDNLNRVNRIRKTENPDEKLEVTIRVHGHANQYWTGQVTHLPESKADEVPMALTNKAGGPLATKPGDKQDKFVPQSQVYLVGIEFDDYDPSITPGVLAQVKVHCEYRTCAWWVWRTLSATFDLGLL